MYLNKKYYTYQDTENKLKISGIKELDGREVKSLVMEAGYWRKANAIHGWFVDNVQDGEDNCSEYYVSEEKLKELLDTVNRVLEFSELVDAKVANGYTISDEGEKVYNWVDGKTIKDNAIAKLLLPVREGFFFGNYDEETAYDENYYQDLVDTKKILEEALSEIEKFDFYYVASW